MFEYLGSSETATYTYDAAGQRVERTVAGTTYDYVFDNQGKENTQGSAGFAGWNWSELYLGGLHVSTYADGSTYFSHADHLGSERMETDPTGNTNSSAQTNLPFGEWTSTGFQSGLGFTGDLHDDGGVFHTPFRQLSQTQGRWMIPDPAGLAAVTPWNPQTWNRYAYVGNNPVTFNDPSGLWMGLCKSAENRQCSTNDPSSANTTGFWDELRLLDGEGTRIIYDDYEDGTIDGSDDLFLVYDQGSGDAANNGTPKSPARQQCEQKAQQQLSSAKQGAFFSAVKSTGLGVLVGIGVNGAAGCVVGAGVGGTIGLIATPFSAGASDFVGAPVGCAVGGTSAVLTNLAPNLAMSATVASAQYGLDVNSAQQTYNQAMQACSQIP